MNSALLAVALAAVAAPAPAEEAIKAPQGLPPAQVIASVTKEGDFEITQTVMVAETRNEIRTANVNGAPVQQTVQVTMFKPVQVQQRIKAAGVKVYTAAGKEVKDAPDKFKKPTIVLYAADGKKVDPFYLKIIKPDTLVIVAQPPSATPAPATNKTPAGTAEDRARAAAEREEAAKRAAEEAVRRAEEAQRAEKEKKPK
jgi:hypothetical protein